MSAEAPRVNPSAALRTHTVTAYRGSSISLFRLRYVENLNHEPVISLKDALGAKIMTYVMTKPCPVCKQQLTKQRPTDTVPCTCGHHVWQG